LYFKPKPSVQPIPDEEGFWKFIKVAFKQPRRTLRNNLASSRFDLHILPEEILQLRAQQMDMTELLRIWNIVREAVKTT
jgi:16S rRNA A1518/A1519 N6-dimethyltransferase RsmA/KsgA/DIM1 with predicted DNA glycosylase/AP lyase activity